MAKKAAKAVKELGVDSNESNVSTVIDRKVEPNKVVSYLEDRLHKYGQVAKQLAYCWNAKTNIYLYGEGGYGKSDGARLFGEYLKDTVGIGDIFYVNFTTGFSEERLMGGMDIKEFNTTGAIKWLLRNAFLNHKYVVFEELGDANPRVLTALKDALERRGVMDGNTFYPMVTEMIVCCSNAKPSDIASDSGLLALMQRFPVQLEVGWNTHNRLDYEQALIKSLNTKGNTIDVPVVRALSMVCGEMEEQRSKNQSSAKRPMPPRIALNAYRLVVENDNEWDALLHIDNGVFKSMSTTAKNHHETAIKAYMNERSIEERIKDLNKMKDRFENENFKDKDIRYSITAVSTTNQIFKEMVTKAIDDAYVQQIKTDGRDTCNKFINILNESIQARLANGNNDSPKLTERYNNGQDLYSNDAMLEIVGMDPKFYDEWMKL